MSSHFLSVMLFAVSSNIDCLAVGLSYGMRKLRIGWAAGAVIGAGSFFGTALSMLAGQGIAVLLPPWLPNLIGGFIIFAVGAAGFIRCALRRAPEQEHGGNISLTWKGAAVLGAALAANNAGLGIGASITGMRVLPTALAVLLICPLFLYIGGRLGKISAMGRPGKYAETFANILMIGLGIYEMLV